MTLPDEIAWLERAGVGLFLDVGANRGQTGQALRAAGYRGRICSFEPIAVCHAVLARQAVADPLWEAHHTGLGETDGTAAIGVSENFVSSSFLPATDRLIDIYAPIRYVRTEETPMARLDTVLGRIAEPGDVIHLKIDTQGFECAVIAGASGVWDRIGSVRMEVAVDEVYRGEMILREALPMMETLGHVLIGIEPAWRHPDTGEVLHHDLLFRRR